jgi:uncharacterized SAM-binding protein YcdF (DUF218 family)
MPTYVQPLFPMILVLALVGLVIEWRSRGHRRLQILATAFVLLLILSWPPFYLILLQPFEHPYRHKQVPVEGAQAIVVLSSGIQYPTVPGLPAARIGSDTYERCQYAAWLQKKSGLFVLASGGGNQEDPDTPPYAVLMKDALIKEGVPESMILSEDHSRTTHENAVYSAQILRDRRLSRIILVTDAYHMLRAEKSFRKQGLQVVPAASGFRTFEKLNLVTLLPNWEALGFGEDLLHESIGLLWYRLRGWI